MKRFYGGVISGSTNITGSGFLSPATVQLKSGGSSATMDATGGTITFSGNYKIHTFTTSGTFTVTSGTNYTIEYLIVGGGGGSRGTSSGAINSRSASPGAGAGGYMERIASNVGQGQDYIAPIFLVNSGDTITIVVGGGGAAGPGNNAVGNTSGGPSTMSSTNYYVLSAGGALGDTSSPGQLFVNYNMSVGASGSGGGAYGGPSAAYTIGALSNQQYPIQGVSGGNASSSGVTSGSGGGPAKTSGITGNVYSVGGAGIQSASGNAVTGTAGAANTGNGGGGSASPSNKAACTGAAGGSGIVVIRYLYQ